MYVCVHIHMYIYIYRERERPGRPRQALKGCIMVCRGEITELNILRSFAGQPLSKLTVSAEQIKRYRLHSF